MVDVVFRKDGEEIVAVFPTITWSHMDLQCYVHDGQHGSCTRGWYMGTKPAKPKEYAPLLEELKRVGYQTITIKTRIPPKNWYQTRM